MWVNFLFLQSAMPSAHLQGVGQVQEAEGKHSKVSSSSVEEHCRGRIEVSLCPWYSNGSIQTGILDVAVFRLTLVVLCSHKIIQFMRQSQTQGLSSNVNVFRREASSIKPRGNVDS
jgi:hypothetical protein